MRTRFDIPWHGIERLAALAKQPLILLLVAGVVSALSVTAGFRSLGGADDEAPAPGAKAGPTDAAAPWAGNAVTISLGEPGTAANRLSISVHDLAPGDRAERTVDLTVGPVSPADVVLGTTATTSSILDTDRLYGLQLTIERCPVPWVQTGPDDAMSFACPAAVETVLASGPVVQADRPVGGSLLLAEGATNYLRTELYLPDAAGNDHADQFSVIRFDFEAVPYA